MTRRSDELGELSPESGRRPPRRRGVGLIIGIVVLCLVSASGGALAMRLLQPASLQQSTTPITVTVLVEKGVLSQTLVTRGQVSYASTTAIAYRGNAGSTVTDVAVSQGQQVQEGDRLLDVSGRPIIALTGVVPAYRDLSPGDQGKDVQQLNDALVRLGLLADSGDLFTTGTATAVGYLYQLLGYDAPPPTAAAQEAVAAQQSSVRQAQDALDQANAQVTPASLLAAQLAVEQAQEAVQADPNSTTAQFSLLLAKQQLAEAENPPSVAAAQNTLSAAKSALAAARQEAVPSVAMSEIAFVPLLPAAVTSLTTRIGATTDGPLLQLGSGQLGAQARLSTAQRTLVATDQTVAVQSDDGVGQAQGRITSIGTQMETAFDGTQAFIAGISLENGDASLAGQPVKVTITVQQTAEEVLYVPQAAVLSDSDGQTYVERCPDASNPNSCERVSVTVGIVTSGSVEIRSEGVNVGDRVVVDQIRR